MTNPGMDNTTQALHYPVDDRTTQSLAVPGAVHPADAITGRVPVSPAHPQAHPPAHPGAGNETMLNPMPPPPAPPRQRGTRRGQTTIADEVVERVIQKVVDLTVAEVAGVHGLRPGVATFFEGTDAASDKAVAVKLADGQATIHLSIEVDFGYAVHEVVDQVRESVIGQAERLLGLTVAEVNVVVSDVSFDEPPAAAAATGPATADEPKAPSGRRPRS